MSRKCIWLWLYRELAQDIVNQTDNQYFMSLKSTQFIKELLDHAREELAVFFLKYRND